MKKIALLLLSALLLCTTACNSGTPAPSADAQTYTGFLEQIKDDMILVVAENNDSVLYSFGREGIAINAELGDKVIVTYTGDMDNVDSLLEASKVEAIK